MLATEHTLLRMFLNIWRQILFPGGRMMLLFRISVQLNVEPLIATPSTLEQLPGYFYLITRQIQSDCFGRSVY